jgi:phosphatidylserine/phosphatidylglycerophosphate/cardiolipin synthase-like enzyme
MTRFFFPAVLLTLFISPAHADPSVNVAFSPHAGATEAVVSVISDARHSIHVAGYGFTSKPIAQALIDAHQRDIEVEAVLDKSNNTAKSTEATDIAHAGIPVRIDSRYAIMHNKFIVVDGQTVETGSFNFTSAAENSNAENLLVLHEYPDVASQYEARWQMLWAESEDYQTPSAKP